MRETDDATAAATDETSWTDYVEALWRWRRFVVIGTLGTCIAIAVLAWLIPRHYECTATLSLPGASIPVPLFGTPLPAQPADAVSPSDSEPKAVAPQSEPGAGITSTLYKRLERVLADGALLEKGLDARLGPPGVHDVAGRLRFSPITNGPRSLTERRDKEERMTAVQISYAGRSAECSREVMIAMGSLVRDALLTVTVLDQIETEGIAASSLAVQAARERMRLQAEDEGLALEQAAAVRLVREYPGVGADLRAIVDVKGGYRYLFHRPSSWGSDRRWRRTRPRRTSSCVRATPPPCTSPICADSIRRSGTSSRGWAIR